ncbi:MAG: hypothetical protein JWN75_758 [Candidatus Saccharibacteria bacterium]|nr:hypothetical protein [Candidatus Saccharibacteria bacterium]
MDYNYNYTYDTSGADGVTNAASVAFLGVFFLFMLVLVIASYAIGAFLLGRLFKKAGIPQWIAWVPIYNTWKLLEMGGQQGFWAVLALIPFLNIVALIFLYIAMYDIGKKLGKEGWFVLLAIFVPIVWLIWLGFDDSKWPNDKKPVTTKSTKRTAKAEV